MRTLLIFSAAFSIGPSNIPWKNVARSVNATVQNSKRGKQNWHAWKTWKLPPLFSIFTLNPSISITTSPVSVLYPRLDPGWGLRTSGPHPPAQLLYWRMPTNSRRQRGNSVILAWDWRMPLNLLFQGYAQHSGLKFIPRPRPKTDNRGGFGNNLALCCCQISLSEHKHRIRMNYIQ